MIDLENHGLIEEGFENLPDRIREKLQYFWETTLTYQTLFNFPANLRFVDSIYYDGDAEVESSKTTQNLKRCRFTDTAVLNLYKKELNSSCSGING
jgi:hypothetical protein